MDLDTKRLSEICDLLSNLLFSLRDFKVDDNFCKLALVRATIEFSNNKYFYGYEFEDLLSLKKELGFYEKEIILILKEISNYGVSSFEMVFNYHLSEEQNFYQFGNDGEYYYLNFSSIWDELNKRMTDVYRVYEYHKTLWGCKNKTLTSDMTTKEFIYYDKAIEFGMAEKTDNGYKWLYNNGSKASLAYFLYKLFCPKGTGQIPFKRLNILWNVTRMDSALNQVLSAKNNQPWRVQIDCLFTD